VHCLLCNVQGQWRLLVPNNIMYALGYPYTVQADDDLFVTEAFKVCGPRCLLCRCRCLAPCMCLLLKTAIKQVHAAGIHSRLAQVNVVQHMRSGNKLMGTHRISREGRCGRVAVNDLSLRLPGF
jgi:hypothetical protein